MEDKTSHSTVWNMNNTLTLGNPGQSALGGPAWTREPPENYRNFSFFLLLSNCAANCSSLLAA